MKKLIMFGLAVVAACAVNAASFSWASTANGTDGSGNTLTSASDAATFVLCYLGNTGDATAPSYANAVQVGAPGTWTVTTSKGVSTAKVQGTYYGDGAEGFANGNVYAVMVKDESGGLHEIAGTSTYTVSGYSGDTWAGPTFQFATSSYVADKASYPAPEPTSGLMMLVGLGLLGLRRKRK